MTKKPIPLVNALEIFVASELKKFEFTVPDLQQKVYLYKDLTIKNLADKKGLSIVHDARMDLKTTRVAIEKTGKNLRASANAFNKSILAREGELVGVISLEESRLAAEEDLYEQWKEAERMEAERQEAARLDERIKKLRAVNADHDMNADHDIVALKLMPDESFADILEDATKAYTERKEKEAEEEALRIKEKERADREFKAEQAKVKREQEELRQEQEKVRKGIEEMEKAKKEVQEMRAKLDQQKKEHEDKLAAEAAEKKRLEDLETARKEGEEKAKREADELKQRQQQQDLLKEQAAKERIAQERAELPDKEKILTIAHGLESFISGVAAYTIKSVKYRKIQVQSLEMLGDVANLLLGKDK